METTKAIYKAMMQAQLKLWSTRLDACRVRLAKTTGAARVELLKQIVELKAFKSSAHQHIATVDQFTADRWQDVKAEVETTWDRLRTTVEAMWAAAPGV